MAHNYTHTISWFGSVLRVFIYFNVPERDGKVYIRTDDHRTVWWDKKKLVPLLATTLSSIEQTLRANGIVFDYFKRVPNTPKFVLNAVNKNYEVTFEGDGWKMLMHRASAPFSMGKHTRAVLIGERELYWMITK